MSYLINQNTGFPRFINNYISNFNKHAYSKPPFSFLILMFVILNNYMFIQHENPSAMFVWDTKLLRKICGVRSLDQLHRDLHKSRAVTTRKA